MNRKQRESGVDGVSRRAFGVAGLAALIASQSHAEGLKPAAGQFGQINKLTAKHGQVAALRGKLLVLTGLLVASLPDALTYEVLSCDGDPETIWTIELWTSAEAHTSAVAAQSVQAMIAQIRQFVERFENVATFNTIAPVVSRRSAAANE